MNGDIFEVRKRPLPLGDMKRLVDKQPFGGLFRRILGVDEFWKPASKELLRFLTTAETYLGDICTRNALVESSTVGETRVAPHPQPRPGLEPEA